MLSAKGYPVPVAKRCSKCGGTKPAREFNKDSSTPSGLQYACRRCQTTRWTSWYGRNQERRKEYQRRFYAGNGQWYAEYRAENADRRNAYTARWAKENPQRRAESAMRRRAHKSGARHVPYDRAAVFERWNGLCGYGCGRPAEHLDHITPLSRGGADIESNLIPACAEENLSKGARSLAEWALSWL